MNKNKELIQALDVEIKKCVDELGEVRSTAKYQELLTRIQDLQDIKGSLKTFNFKVSPEVLLTVGGNLLGILLIINHERLNVITTKALGFVLKSRV